VARTKPRAYEQARADSAFYRIATFYSTEEVEQLLLASGFEGVEMVQTVFGRLDEVREIQAWRPGHGEGGFVVLSAKKRDGDRK
jgi:hypothetical protein